MALEYILSVVVTLVVTTVLYFNCVFNYWKRKNVYARPVTIPFGNARGVVLGQKSLDMDIHELYQELKAKGLPYGGYYLLNQKIFVPVDQTLIHNILIKEFQHFTDHGLYINEETDPLSGHLFFLKGAKWKVLRAKLTPVFTSGKMKMMFQTLVDCTRDLPSLIEKARKASEPVDIKDAFARYTTDVIGSCAFGIDCNCLKNPDAEFRNYGIKALHLDLVKGLKRILTIVAPNLSKTLNISFNDKSVEKFFINLVKQTIEHRDNNNVKRNDFMQLLLDLRHAILETDSKSSNGQNVERNGFYQKGLNLKELVAQAYVFFLAGFETSSTTLNFLMYEITTNPEIQEKLIQEIREVLSRHDGQVTYDSISEMTYLDKCILETLRKYPVISLPRVCTKAYRVPNSELVIEKDTLVVVSTYGIHHDPEYYPEPEKFHPERFSEVNKQKRLPCTYIPFGEGPRICIGLRFGVLQTKVGLIALLRNHRFRLNPRTKTPLTFDPRQIVLTVEGGIWVDVEKIDPF